MSEDLKQRLAGLSPEKRALLQKRLAQKREAEQTAAPDAIAIVGMGCRFPGGADSPGAYWDMLMRGVDAIGEIPPDRWNADELFDPNFKKPGRMATRWGGFLSAIDRFDARFFGISPREARLMDPQQRILLETAWEALEDAGLTLERLSGTPTGVYVGVHSHSSDYYQLQIADPEQIGTYTSTGTAHSIVANRLSYLFNLQGPSVAMDTACSSSLVAVHLACQSIRTGESRMALAAGVNLIITPEATISFSKLQMMSADGRCKTFDSRADGFVRGEGCGVVVLKKLSDAEADGDRILAVIRASAVNQDGNTNGLTAPNGISQQAVVAHALKTAGVDPGEIGYVETHGTGTPLGDPIEVEALNEALRGRDVKAGPCCLGAVKTNIGHLEAAAGIAGLIKAALVLEREKLPPNLHLKTLNPHLSLDGTRFKIPTEVQPWPRGETRRLAGVSSFGFGGTNAHILLEEAPAPAAAKSETPPPERRAHALPLSARSEAALRDAAERYAQWLETGEDAANFSLNEICRAAALRRTHHNYRLAATAVSREEMPRRLREFAVGEPDPAFVFQHRAPERAPGTVFVFSGQGTQWAGMGRELMETEPAFRESMERCDAELRKYAEWSLIEEIEAAPEQSRLNQTEIAQPALFAVQVSLTALLRSWGVRPDAVVGHSVGEVAAAHAAGALSFEDAIRLIFYRGDVMRGAAPGRTAAIELSPEALKPAMQKRAGRVDFAAFNGPEATVISGETDAVLEIVEELKAQNVRCHVLPMECAFHSETLEPQREKLVGALRDVKPSRHRIPFYSTVTGETVPGEQLNADYWGRNFRQPVRFARAVERALNDEHRVFVELAPHPALVPMIARCAGDRKEVFALGTLRRETDASAVMVDLFARLYALGVSVDWKAFHPGPARHVPLPTYPWQHESYWIKPSKRGAAAKAKGENSKPSRNADEARRASAHPLLGERLPTSLPIFEKSLDIEVLPWLAEHRVHGMTTPPGSFYMEMLLAGARELFGDGPMQIENLEFCRMLVFNEDRPTRLQLVLQPDVQASVRAQIFSRAEDEDDWTLHVACSIGRESSAAAANETVGDAGTLCNRPDGRAIPVDKFYEGLERRGFETGPAFRGIQELCLCDGEVAGRIVASRECDEDSARCEWPPAFLDACFQLLDPAARNDDEQPDSLYMLTRIARSHFYRRPSREVYCRAVRADDDNGNDVAVKSLEVFDDAGLLARFEGLAFGRADASTVLRMARPEHADWLYDVVWREKPIAETPQPTKARPASPSVERILERLREKAPQAENGEAADRLLKQLDRLCALYAHKALRRLGWNPDEANGGQLDVAPAQRRLFAHLKDILESESAMDGNAQGRASEMCEVEEPEALAAELRGRHPAISNELELLHRCGKNLDEILRGRLDPIALLFPSEDAVGAEYVYRDAPFSRSANRLAAEALTGILEGRPKDAPLKILEVGAGTGSATAALLPLLRDRSARYVFTDLSPVFLDKARAEFADERCVDYRLLDLEKPPAPQLECERDFDLILASNVLHATSDLRRSLEGMRGLLAPGGLLLLVEGVERRRWIDLTFGLTSGWWNFEDRDLRPDYPLLDADRWTSLLRETGFAQAAAFPVGGTNAFLFPQSIILAKNSATPADASEGQRREVWCITSDRAGVGGRLADLLREKGEIALLLEPATAYQAESEDRIGMDWTDPAHWRRLREERLQSDTTRMRGLIYTAALDAPEEEPLDAAALEKAARELCGGALALLQNVHHPDQPDAERLWFVTRRAQPAAKGAVHPLASTLWGFGRVVALERPEAWGGMIDMDSTDDPQSCAQCALNELMAGTDEDHVAYRAGRRLVMRLERAERLPKAVPDFSGDGTWLITGGLGGLGLKLAGWLTERGARHVTLLGRTDMPPRDAWKTLDAESEDGERARAVEALERAGAKIEIVAADVADEKALQTLFTRFDGELPRLRGLFHAATEEIESAPLSVMSVDALSAMLRPKVVGGWLLHRLSAGMKLDAFVLFSSAANVWGGHSFAHYAAANHYLDALAHYRKMQGLPALSIDWGRWDRLPLTSARDRAAVERAGILEMSSDAALEIMARLIGSGDAQKVVAAIDWNILKPALEMKKTRPMLSGIQVRPHRSAGEGVAGSRWRARLEAARPRDRAELLIELLQKEVARILGLTDCEQIDPDKGFFELGMDSLMTVELKNRLESAVGRALPQTLTFNYPTVAGLAGFLQSEVFAWPPQQTPTTERDETDGWDEVEHLTEEEARRQLDEELGALPADLWKLDER